MSDDKLTNVSRREFARNLAKLLVFGSFAHFVIPGSASIKPSGNYPKADCPGGREPDDVCIVGKGKFGLVDRDYCPGGGPLEDVCRPDDGFSDYCPGEKEPEDNCSPSGLREKKFGKWGSNVRQDDYCDTGLPENDKCDTKIAKSDQCLGQGPAWDECDPSQDKTFDVCYSGLDVDDACERDGGNKSDECPGGGVDRDTCTVSGDGDECSPEKEDNPDSCKTLADGATAHRDVCGTAPREVFKWQSDECYLGINDKNTNIGGGDLCKDQKVLGLISRGNGGDTCLDGSAEQDDCGGGGEESTEIDVCIPGAAGEKDDLCNPLIATPRGGFIEGSDDICYAGLPSSDECKPMTASVGDQDECPGGLAPADECAQVKLDTDECPGGVPNADECSTGLRGEDECPGGGNDVDLCLPNVSGSDECESIGVTGEDSGLGDDNKCTDRNPDYAE